MIAQFGNKIILNGDKWRRVAGPRGTKPTAELVALYEKIGGAVQIVEEEKATVKTAAKKAVKPVVKKAAKKVVKKKK